MRIKILQIIPTLVRGGAEKQMTLLAAGLPRDQFDVRVVVLTHSGPYEQTLRDRDIPIDFINKRWKADPFAYRRLSNCIRRFNPDVVHTWIFAANSYGRYAAIRAGVKVIIAGERCVDPWKREYEFAIDRYLARRTTRIVTNSTGVRDFYAEHGIAPELFEVIPNGIVPLAPDSDARNDLLRELSLPSDTKLIVAVGRLWPQKRYKDLIWAADLLKCVRDDVHLLIVGDGPERERLTRYRDQIEIADRVHFLGERGDVSRILTHADIYWIGSSYEGQSNGVMEAMSLGIPVIATDIPGNRDLVVNGQTGYLVPVGDRAEFARRTRELLDDINSSQRLGAAGKHRIVTDFTVQGMVDRHVELYQRLCSEVR